jgi:hypothetical protein
MKTTVRLALLALAASATFACAAPVGSSDADAASADVDQDSSTWNQTPHAENAPASDAQVNAAPALQAAPINTLSIMQALIGHYSDSNIHYLGFEYDNGHAITDEQPWDGLRVDQKKASAGWCDYPFLDVMAGRQGSAAPMNWFNARNGSAKISNVGRDNIMSMNFAFSGWLRINDDRFLVVVGQ